MLTIPLQLLTERLPSSSEPLTVYNNCLRWAIFQLDRSLLEEADGAVGAAIPVPERTKLIGRIRQEKVKEYSWADISRHLDTVLELQPWHEFSQADFFNYVAGAELLPKEMLLQVWSS